MNLNGDFGFLSLDGDLLTLEANEEVSVMLENIVLKLLSSSVLLDCPSNASRTVLGEWLCVFFSSVKSFRAGEAALSLLFSHLEFN